MYVHNMTKIRGYRRYFNYQAFGVCAASCVYSCFGDRSGKKTVERAASDVPNTRPKKNKKIQDRYSYA